MRRLRFEGSSNRLESGPVWWGGGGGARPGNRMENATLTTLHFAEGFLSQHVPLHFPSSSSPHKPSANRKNGAFHNIKNSIHLHGGMFKDD